MKLIFAIVNNDDSHAVLSGLTVCGFQVTKLASTGGFLKAGNTTFMIAAEDSKVDEIINIVKSHSKRRKQIMVNDNDYSADGGASYTSFPSEVAIGGATIMVTDIDRFEKL